MRIRNATRYKIQRLDHSVNNVAISDRLVIHSPVWLEGVTRCRHWFSLSLDRPGPMRLCGLGPLSRSCLTSPCSSTGNVGGPLVSLWQYPTSLSSLHAWHGLVAVFGFPVAVSDFARISARLAWFCCSIRLCCGSIRLRPNLCTPGMVSLRYPTSLWQYLTSP